MSIYLRHLRRVAAVQNVLGTRADANIYLAARLRGETVPLAFARVRAERAARAVLTERYDDDGGPFGYDDLIAAYDVDPIELARVTASWPHPVTLPAGATARVFLYSDVDTRPEDMGDYSADDLTAWRDDRWSYALVLVRVTLADGRTGGAETSGVEVGDYWPCSIEAQAWDVASELISEAVANAWHDDVASDATSARITATADGDLKLSTLGVTVATFRGDDGATVVQIDTLPGGGRLRVNVNDAPIFDADPEA